MTPFTPENVNIGTLSWQSTEKF